MGKPLARTLAQPGGAVKGVIGLAGVAIDLTDAGAGTHSLAFYDQARYTMNGTIDTGSNHALVADGVAQILDPEG